MSAAAMESPFEVLGHDAVLEGLWRAERDGRLHHGFLFEGPSGVGKLLAAKRFVAGLFCAAGPGPPCGTCGPCVRLSTGGEEANHPDLLVVDALARGEERVLIKYVAFREEQKDPVPLRRTVEGFLDLKRQEAPYRAVLLRDADRMNPNAQNALLKTLEEPRPGTLLVLVATSATGLLDTTTSRVTRVRFERLDLETTARIVAREAPALDSADVTRHARWASGSPGRALELVGQRRSEMVALLARVLTGELGPMAAGLALSELDLPLPGRTESAKARARVRWVLDLLLEWQLDLARLASGVPAEDLAAGPELAAALAGRDGAWTTRLDHVRSALERARRDLDQNITPAALLDSAMLALAALAPKRS